MSVARFIADQRTNYRVPHTVTCAAARGQPGVVLQVDRTARRGRARSTGCTPPGTGAATPSTAPSRWRSGKAKGLHGSPRLHADLRDDGWQVSEKTVADSMRRQGLMARRIKRRNGLTRQDKTAPKFPDLLKRDFTAGRPNAKWVGDMTEIPTGPTAGRSCTWPP